MRGYWLHEPVRAADAALAFAALNFRFPLRDVVWKMTAV